MATTLNAWSVGQFITAAHQNEPVSALGAPTSWTPVITGSTTSPTNYTATGTYTRIRDLIIAEFNIQSNASWTNGSGTYSFSLPVTAVATTAISGSARLVFSGPGTAPAQVELTSTTAFRLIYMTSFTATLPAGAAAPAAWPVSTATIIKGQVIYTAA